MPNPNNIGDELDEILDGLTVATEVISLMAGNVGSAYQLITPEMLAEAKAAIQQYTAQQVQKALEKVRAEILSLTTGGPRGVEASADIVTKAIANQGILPNSNEGREK